MLHSQQIIGLPVLDIETGKECGHCNDILISRNWSAAGILLDVKRWFASPRFVGWEDIISVGDDAITIPSVAVLQELDKKAEDWFELKSLHGREMFTIHGHRIGAIENVYFPENMGRNILGFELTDGFLTDIQEGRHWIPLPDKITLGEDAVIVPVSAEQLIEKIVAT
ncbi:PRC-barrel domain-containing protein [Marinicrinis lubricantis]|uniref:PRC-barrel domain-containing protein n=1 Tax=Marinicrinis lubricantis TaxID=2086470 RepID=A0ABW1IVS0_9BACL